MRERALEMSPDVYLVVYQLMFKAGLINKTNKTRITEQIQNKISRSRCLSMVSPTVEVPSAIWILEGLGILL